MTKHYFPDADEPALQPFSHAFVRLMFAHAAFERRVSDLLAVITGVIGFGERQENARWSADKRPKLMKKLINQYHPDGLPETADIVARLKRSISFCRDRNLLAHGSWWEFNVDEGTITVRSGVEWRKQDQHQTFTVAKIEDTATSLDDLEVELWKLQRAIEARAPVRRPSAGKWSSQKAALRWVATQIHGLITG
jgi:hypothetical protein